MNNSNGYSGYFLAAAPFHTTKFGDFDILASPGPRTGSENVTLVKGSVAGSGSVLCRVASACLTSTAFGAADCDCAGQLDDALTRIAEQSRGVLLYLAQEGRGNGLVSKIAAMNGKEKGLDTFRATEELGLDPDVRSYNAAARILSELRIKSIVLMTNNPDKETALTSNGVQVEGMLPCIDAHPPARSLIHLNAKRALGHML
ncbi:GTP cyclohydrolase II [Actinomycetospora callitridis]|uniref:GTP cyclohydrolase II n=1 Tax=Actinomycetospora callitridis TaxID=913944 RepID=UPI002365017F|nr:GTP cyclohydrolase II [Actinomycetospora callitridis]MDD7917988.1 GTP cyclohydrolase II [Actinomycetospora callitridis]